MEDIWNIITHDFNLSADHIELCKINLKNKDNNIFLDAKYLSKEECARAEKYMSVEKAREFIITRSTLRKILGHALNEDPLKFEFRYTKHGMPVLSYPKNTSNITFNVSHTHDIALIAMTMGEYIGVDIEKIRTNIDHEKLAERFFSENEYIAIMQYTGKQRLHSFFATWTRKEAIVKATGIGIASGLKSFDVSVHPEGPAKLVEVRWESEVKSQWKLDTINVGDSYFACLASNGPPREIRYWILN